MNFLKVTLIIFLLFQFNFVNADEQDKRNQITKNLRCLICQGQSVYDSQSDFALSMKKLIRIKIKEGNTEDEIYNFLKEKYEDAHFISSTEGTNLDKLVSEIIFQILGDLRTVTLLTSPKNLDSLHKYSKIINVINNENQLEVDVEIRNYYLNNLLEREVVKILS